MANNDNDAQQHDHTDPTVARLIQEAEGIIQAAEIDAFLEKYNRLSPPMWAASDAADAAVEAGDDAAFDAAIEELEAIDKELNG